MLGYKREKVTHLVNLGQKSSDHSEQFWYKFNSVNTLFHILLRGWCSDKCPMGYIRAEASSQGQSHHLSQEQGNWASLVAASSLGIKHLPGDGPRLSWDGCLWEGWAWWGPWPDRTGLWSLQYLWTPFSLFWLVIKKNHSFYSIGFLVLKMRFIPFFPHCALNLLFLCKFNSIVE